jgi:hypothetical protein
MWTIDMGCSRCTHRQSPQNPTPATPCADRVEIVRGLQALTTTLNAAPFEDTPGDGILIVACKDFAVA